MSIKEICKFLAGFQLAHTLGHIVIQFSANFPLTENWYFFKVAITSNFNLVGIIVNFIIFLVLVYFAYFVKQETL